MLEEKIKCEQCGKNEATLIEVFDAAPSKKKKSKESEKWIYLKDVFILVYGCQKCGHKFAKLRKK